MLFWSLTVKPFPNKIRNAARTSSGFLADSFMVF
jgi:hypothetical protein